MILRYLLVHILSLLLVGCNLFTSTPEETADSDVMMADTDLPDMDSGDITPGVDMSVPGDMSADDVDGDMSSPRTTWATVSAGAEHTCALTFGGAAFCWGVGWSGQLGHGSTGREPLAVRVDSTVTFAAIGAGGDHTCALDDAGGLWCWGMADNIGSVDDQDTPELVDAGPFKKMSVGHDGVCVINADDLVKCVGENDRGQLGLPTGADVRSLTDLGGAPFEAFDIALGNEFTCALTTARAVICFGRDLGRSVDDEDAEAFLTQPITTPEPLVTIDAAWAHACGQSVAGDTFCWGEPNLVSELTDGGGPTTAGEVILPFPFAAYESGNDVLCGLDDDGIAYCLGSNYRGIQGKGTDNSNSSIAEPIEGISTEATFRELSIGHRHGCGLTTDDTILCWGQGYAGRLGNGELGWRAEPYELASSVTFATAVLGEYHSCGLDVDGTLHCWGRGAYGALGLGDNEHRYDPMAVADLTFVEADSWASHTCGLQRDGTAYCWGADTNDVLGNGSAGDTNSPDLIVAPEAFSNLSTGEDHGCAIGATDTFCWGDNEEVGQNVGSNRTTPSALPSSDHPLFVQISAGTQHTCGVDANGDAYCFGINSSGQLGDGSNTSSRFVSVAVTGGHTFRFVHTGLNASCGITTSDELYCWGNGRFVPDGSSNNRTSPARDSDSLSWTDVNFGEDSVCGVTTSGEVFCWGDGTYGRLGYGGTSDQGTATAVDLPEPAVHVGVGGEHGCAVGASGKMYCWGTQEFGRLGDGMDSIVREPVPALFDHLDLGQ